jgi:hypothetical protein
MAVIKQDYHKDNHIHDTSLPLIFEVDDSIKLMLHTEMAGQWHSHSPSDLTSDRARMIM